MGTTVGETSDLFDDTSGKWIGVLDRNGKEQVILTYAQQVAVQAMFDGRTITVGEGGRYANLADAIDRVTGMSLSDDAWAHIVLLPGAHELSVTGALPRYVGLSGYGMASVLKLDAGTTTLTPLLTTNQNNVLSNFRILYAPTGTGTKWAVQNGGPAGQAVGSIVQLDRMWIETDYTGGISYCFEASGQRYYEIKDSTLAGSSVCINLLSANTMHIQGCNLWLLNKNVGQSHMGIRFTASGGRLQCRDTKIASGYGPYSWPSNGGIEGESDQDIYGIWLKETTVSSTRCELYNVWSIVRNESGANAGKSIKNVCNAGEGYVRIFGGYFQAEDGAGDLGERYDISNESTGAIQIIGPAQIDRINGTVTSPGTRSGVNVISADATLANGPGGRYAIDSSAGNVNVTLPYVTSFCEFHFKRPSASNTVTITGGGGATINGAASYVIPASAGAYVELYGDGTNWHISGHGSP